MYFIKIYCLFVCILLIKMFFCLYFGGLIFGIVFIVLRYLVILVGGLYGEVGFSFFVMLLIYLVFRKRMMWNFFSDDRRKWNAMGIWNVFRFLV